MTAYIVLSAITETHVWSGDSYNPSAACREAHQATKGVEAEFIPQRIASGAVYRVDRHDEYQDRNFPCGYFKPAGR